VKRQLDRLQASGDTSSALYAALLEKSQQIATMQTLQTSNATVIRTAGTASQVQPRTVRNAAFGLALGLLLGLGLIFLVESLDTRIRSPEELAQQLKLPLLARLPEPPRKLRKRNRLIMIESPQSPAAEAVRVFATNLEFANLDHRASTFLFTSAAEDEGKSTSVANLAISFALSSRRVVLVDLDLRNPQQHRFFALRQQPGLSEVALGRCELTDALAAVPLFAAEGVPSEADGFDGDKTLEVLPCGALPPSAGEFVRSQALTDILDQLRDRAEFVLIDTPPALGAGDAIALSARADAVIVVSNLDKARRPMLDELHRTLQASPAPVLGLAVTGAELEYRYSYGPYSASTSSKDKQVTP
jgi:polysaccharide biosynthesis transport protein